MVLGIWLVILNGNCKAESKLRDKGHFPNSEQKFPILNCTTGQIGR